MLEIKPSLDCGATCPECNERKSPIKLLWQGIHTCVCYECGCDKKEKIFYSDLQVGQAIYTPYIVNADANKLYGSPEAEEWFGKPLLKSITNPKNKEELKFTVEIIHAQSEVIILNCIDYLYGHAFLKLLNAQRHLDQNNELGLIVLVQKSLRWMVPDFVSEIWQVDLSFGNALNFYPSLDNQINNEIKRFDKIYLSRGYSHPNNIDITRFTKTVVHDFQDKNYRITYVWREDRQWLGNNMFEKLINKLGFSKWFSFWQKLKVIRLFKQIKSQLPDATYTIAGLGKSQIFPKWIDDARVEYFDERSERKSCKIYSASRLVVGVHGSNMLLASAHAGITVDLMPTVRWGNLAQDIIFSEKDSRIAVFKYRFLPVTTRMTCISNICVSCIKNYAVYLRQMTPSSL